MSRSKPPSEDNGDSDQEALDELVKTEFGVPEIPGVPGIPRVPGIPALDKGDED